MPDQFANHPAPCIAEMDAIIREQFVVGLHLRGEVHKRYTMLAAHVSEEGINAAAYLLVNCWLIRRIKAAF